MSESVIAVTYAVCAAGGSCAIAAGFGAAGSATPAGKLSARCLASWFANTAPNAATPIEPPTCRKSVEPGRRHAEVLVVDRVLRGEHEHLQHHPEPEAEHEHVDAGQRGRRAGLEP